MIRCVNLFFFFFFLSYVSDELQYIRYDVNAGTYLMDRLICGFLIYGIFPRSKYLGFRKFECDFLIWICSTQNEKWLGYALWVMFVCERTM